MSKHKNANSKKPKSQHKKKYTCDEIYYSCVKPLLEEKKQQSTSSKTTDNDSDNNNKQNIKDIMEKNIKTDSEEQFYTIKLKLHLNKKQQEVLNSYFNRVKEVYHIMSVGASIKESLNEAINRSSMEYNELYNIYKKIEDEKITGNYNITTKLSEEQLNEISFYQSDLITNYLFLAKDYLVPNTITGFIADDVIAKYNTINKHAKRRKKGKIITFKKIHMKIPNLDAYEGIKFENNILKIKLRPDISHPRTSDFWKVTNNETLNKINEITDVKGYTVVNYNQKIFEKQKYNLDDYSVFSSDICKNNKGQFYLNLVLKKKDNNVITPLLYDDITVVGIDRGLRKIATSYSTTVNLNQFHNKPILSTNSFVRENDKPSFKGETIFYTEELVNPKAKSNHTIRGVRIHYYKLRKGLQKEINKRMAVRKFLAENNYVYNGEKITLKDIKYISVRNLKKKLNKLRRKESNAINDINHCISKCITENHKPNTIFVLEDLSGIRKSLQKVKRKERRTQVSWSYYDLEQKIIYKAKRKGQQVIFINPENTSRTCPVCGNIRASFRNRKQHHCKCNLYNCNFQSNDDRTAAINITYRGIETLPWLFALKLKQNYELAEQQTTVPFHNWHTKEQPTFLSDAFYNCKRELMKHRKGTKVYNETIESFRNDLQKYNEKVVTSNEKSQELSETINSIYKLQQGHYNITGGKPLYYLSQNNEIITTSVSQTLNNQTSYNQTFDNTYEGYKIYVDPDIIYSYQRQYNDYISKPDSKYNNFEYKEPSFYFYMKTNSYLQEQPTIDVEQTLNYYKQYF